LIADCGLQIAEPKKRPAVCDGGPLLKRWQSATTVTRKGKRIAAARIARRQRRSVCSVPGGAWWFQRVSRT
jgi:hypothetical protein